MCFIGTAKVRTNAPGQLRSGKQAVGFDNGPLAMRPFRFDRVEPGAFRREAKGQNPYSFPALFDLLIVFSDPGPHALADMPGGIVPNQQPSTLALRLQSLTAPIEKLGGYVA